MIMHMLMKNLLKIIKLKHLMIHVKYVLVKENKNLLNQNVTIKYVCNVLRNLKNNKNINNVQFVDNMIGMKR